ncbi:MULTISPECIES: type I-E CRISPR-associated protein Cse2/CasB [unclassified Streptomyces]|uniref:type I-E CRISPR-associated protein Cse2/CasB n=1 Tax=unclassified Streptomyces TaxID=2593676 RepID=UPI000DAC492B|nr:MULTISPECIES: type I-E CRISPR-associated protein Cse2/CasB [unclassified Streptomyces]PZT76271.1 type I-E CRISPR-associated protein Cse2/CasB [Streptomyces sp. AC1-42W]PZT79774.1 type I-E CRISPR-associated protein Cse2/CasB [Streptomyces sp. AC1-42T]
MTTTTTPALLTPRKQVEQLAGSLIAGYQRGYLADEPSAVAALARLRRGAGQKPERVPDLWNLIDTSSLHAPDEGARELSDPELERAENALHTALTLWALHQQSRREAGMHGQGSRGRPRGLGAAVRRMMKPGEIDDPLRKRLVRAGTAPDLTVLAQRLRDIVLLLRRERFALDYALLAGQLYTWQWPDGPDRVRREWGRSFHAWQAENADDGQEPGGDATADD